ncbi:hypothetical protein Tco_0512012 [Tanacetum coccineum]
MENKWSKLSKQVQCSGKSLQHLPYSPATNQSYPGRLVAGDPFPGRHVARERDPQRQVARDTTDLSLGNMANVVVSDGTSITASDIGGTAVPYMSSHA